MVQAHRAEIKLFFHSPDCSQSGAAASPRDPRTASTAPHSASSSPPAQTAHRALGHGRGLSDVAHRKSLDHRKSPVPWELSTLPTEPGCGTAQGSAQAPCTPWPRHPGCENINHKAEFPSFEKLQGFGLYQCKLPGQPALPSPSADTAEGSSSIQVFC